MKALLNILKKLFYFLDRLLSILGKMIVASLIGLFLLYLAFQNWKEDKTQEENAKVNFQGIKFQFPMKVRGALNAPMNNYSRNFMWLQTDSICGKNISAKWFFDFDNQWKEPNEISDELRQKLTYGVALELHEDSYKTDQEIVAEIQTMYPGDYRYFENHGNKAFIWERGCLTVFVKRTYVYLEGYTVPEVSFCYGLNSSQIDIYGTYTGYINNYPD